jgi:hypothetical protein
MENLREQIKDLEINNLRCLNTCLSHAIDVLSQRFTPTGQGFSHSPYYGVSPFSFMGPNMFPGIDPSWNGVSHSPYGMPQTQFGMPGAPVYPPTYPYYVDRFGGMPRTGLNHTSAPIPGWQPWPTNPMEQQLAQALAARQGFDAFYRGVYG